MLRSKSPLAFALAFALALAAAAPASSAAPMQQAPADITYTISMPEPATHLYTVRVSARGLAHAGDSVDLRMPVWTPGSYLIREFERNVQDFATVATAPGAAAPRWQKVDKNTWRVWTEGDAVEVTYRVYANEMSVRTSHLDDTHGYFNGANVFMYVDGHLKDPVRLRVETPKRWDVATSLARDPNARKDENVFVAPDYDRLVDSPVETGVFARIEFEALGKPHTIALFGKGNYEEKRLREDVKKIVETAAAVFGGTLPYDRYVFIVHLYPQGGGGLEHLSSMTAESSPFVFQNKESYQGFLGLISHEFFHAWNVKRIHPPALGPFDYTRENYTKMLWLMEGTTDYYADVILERAGLMTTDEHNKALAKTIQQYEETPGRRHMSLEEASADAWVKYYRPSEHSPNSQISYYLKGALVSALLDMEIRGRTSNAKSLDDVMRYLWETYAVKGLPVPEDGVQPAVEAVAGGSYQEFFDKYVRGTADIDYNAFLKSVGLRLVTEVKKDDGRVDPSRPSGWLGATLVDDGNVTTVRAVPEDSPAWKAGLNVGDQVLALDGTRVTAASIGDRVADRQPGETVLLTAFHRDDLKTIRVVLGQRPPDTYKVEKIPAPKPEAAPTTKPAAPAKPRRGRRP